MNRSKCCICNTKFVNKYDMNNASPVKDGYCCSMCNMLIVIPARMNRLMKGEK